MKKSYLIVALFILCGCAHEVKNSDDFDAAEMTEDTASTADEFATFDEPTSKSSASTVNDVEALAVEEDITSTPQPALEAPPAAAHRPTTKTAGYYAVQIGAFPSQTLAKKRAAVLGFDRSMVSFQSADVNGQRWHRVLVGKFKNKKSAVAFQKKVSGETIIRNVQSAEASLGH